MRNKNTLSRSKYLWENLYWTVMTFLLYRPTIFCPVLGFSYKASLFILAGIVIINLGVSIFITYRRRRNHISVLCNQFLAYGCYFMLSLWAINRSSFINITLLALTLATAYSLLVLVCYCCDCMKSSIVGNLGKCLSSCVMNARTIVACVLAVVLLSSAFKPIVGLPLLEPAADQLFNKTEDLCNDGETIAGNIDTVLLLQEEEWAKLDAAARLEVMKTIADIEANYLGIPEMTIGADVLEEETLGQYNDATKTITLNLSHLAYTDAYPMLFALCHECYHAYQHKLVEVYNGLDSDYRDLLLFYEASQYREEFANYIDGSDDYMAYSTQMCEEDSDRYAAGAALDYYSRISSYLEEHSTED